MDFKSLNDKLKTFIKGKPIDYDAINAEYQNKTNNFVLDLEKFKQYISTSNIGSLATGYYLKTKEERNKLYDKYRNELCKILNKGGFPFVADGADYFHNGYGFSCRLDAVIMFEDHSYKDSWSTQKIFKATQISGPIKNNFSICHDDKNILANFYIGGFFGGHVIQFKLADWSDRYKDV